MPDHLICHPEPGEGSLIPPRGNSQRSFAKAQDDSIKALDFFREERLQEMAMTMRLIFRAMTKQREGLLLRQVLKQTQGEFLSVVFDSLVPRIYPAGFH